jgi:hypothetical protein
MQTDDNGMHDRVTVQIEWKLRQTDKWATAHSLRRLTQMVCRNVPTKMTKELGRYFTIITP